VKQIIHIILLLFYAVSSLAAQDSIGFAASIPYLQQSTAGLTSTNAAWLQSLPVQKVAMAEVYASSAKGGFVDYYQPNTRYELGARTESYVRLSPRLALYGLVRYANLTEKNISGSAFINPPYNAFDLIEVADSTRGDKSRETFHLVGGFGAQLWRGLALGGKLDYTTANYAKLRDLRHTNKLLDLSASAGLSYRLLPTATSISLTLGAAYLYRRSVEGLQFKTYGTTDQQHYTLISFGSFFGRQELFSTTGTGYTIQSTPMFNEHHGASTQLSAEWQCWSLFAETSYQQRTGYYGKKSPNTPIFTHHEGKQKSAATTLAYDNRHIRHALSLCLSSEQLDTYENIFRENNTSGNRTDIEYLGDNIMLAKKLQHVGAAYTAYLGIENLQPRWQLKAGGDWRSRRQTASVYPYFRRQSLQFYDVYASASRSIARSKNRYDLSLGATYGAGSGAPKTDGEYAPPSSTQRPPKSLDTYLLQEYEFLTAARFIGSAELSFSRQLMAQLTAYIIARGEITRGAKTEYISDSTFNVLSLSIGCKF
jgi:hypothetical protein